MTTQCPFHGAAAVSHESQQSHEPRPRGPLPGPRGLPLVGALPAMLRAGPFPYITRCWRQYGDMFMVPTVGRGRITFVAHPDAIERVLTAPDIYAKTHNYDPVRPLLGEGLLTSNGAFWLHQRKLIQPAYSSAMLAGYLPAIARCVDDMLVAWEARCATGETFDLYQDMLRLTHRVAGFTLFGMDLGGSADSAAAAVAESLDIAGQRINRAAAVLPLAIPTPGNLRFRRALQTLDRLVYDVIARARRAAPDERQEATLLRLLIDARGDDGAPMSDRQLRDEIVTQYVAAQETAALALTWGFHQLGDHPEVSARMAAEAAGVSDSAPSLEELDRLAYTRMAIDEILRLRSPVWALTRVAQQDDRLRGHPIAAGSTVMFGVYMAHRHPDFWDEPEAFRPERFTPERVRARHRYAYLPFVGGPRVCIGRRFALYEVSLAMAKILRRFEVEIVAGEAVGVRAGATCQPDGPVLARLRPRR